VLSDEIATKLATAFVKLHTCPPDVETNIPKGTYSIAPVPCITAARLVPVLSDATEHHNDAGADV